MKSSASGTVKGDVIAEGSFYPRWNFSGPRGVIGLSPLSRFLRGMRVIITFSNKKSSCINKILMSNILRGIQLVYIQLYAMKSDRMSQNFNSI